MRKNCNKLYIGETDRHLGDRIRDHLNDIRKNDLSKPVSRHFTSSNHSISDFVAFGLSVINGVNDRRKTKEMRLFHALSTPNPHRINKRFTFCSPSVVPEPYCLLNNSFLTYLYPFTYLAHCVILFYIAV